MSAITLNKIILPAPADAVGTVMYNVRVTQNCGSPAPYWIENITAE